MDQNGGGVDVDIIDANKDGTFVFKLALYLFLFALVGAAVFFYLYRQSVLEMSNKVEEQSANIEKIENNLTEHNNAGEYTKALGAFEDLVSASGNISDDEKYAAEIVRANLKIASGEDVVNQIAILRGVAVNENAPKIVRAQAINMVLNFYYETRSYDRFEMIFKDGWSDLSQGNDNKLALRKLSDLSYEIYPNTGALLRSNYWYNGQLIDNAKNISQEEKKNYLSKVRNNLEEIERIQPGENAYRTESAYASYLHRKAFSEAVLAMVEKDMESAKKFEDDYDGVISRYNSELSRLGKTSITETLPYTYFYYASFTNEVYGAEKREKVLDLVNKLVSLVRENKNDKQIAVFLDFMKEEWSKPQSEKDHNYNFFITLSKLSPDFKTFLKENGWQI